MPIRTILKDHGTLTPSQVALIGRVFDQLAAKMSDPAERESLAARILAAYQSGITDEDELAAVLDRDGTTDR